MNDLMRPTLYEAHHDIFPVTEPAPGAEQIKADRRRPGLRDRRLPGARTATLPEPQPGDLLAIMSAGAYGAVQAGTYNTRLLVPEVLVDGDKWGLIRPRLRYEDLIGLDRVPNWLL